MQEHPLHDSALTPDDLTFDFGITGLGGSFHGDWILDAESEQQHIAAMTGFTEHGIVSQLLLIEDVLRLRDSALTGAEVSTLWELTNSNAFDGSPSIKGRECVWLDEVLAVVVPVVERFGAPTSSWTSIAPCLPHHDHQALAGEVKAVPDLVRPRQNAGVTPHEARAAVNRCADTVCPELAFRFALHALTAFHSSVSPQVFDRLGDLGSRFGYGEYVVGRIDYLVD
ncbi:hypothetical protein [Streptomyces sp. NPDC006307]|uniref:hypothetical protein n=1 Tax=Streptomyces sp. NPDC006307 TaxID=3156748 RepID=UPI00339DCCB5